MLSLGDQCKRLARQQQAAMPLRRLLCLMLYDNCETLTLCYAAFVRQATVCWFFVQQGERSPLLMQP